MIFSGQIKGYCQKCNKYFLWENTRKNVSLKNKKCIYCNNLLSKVTEYYKGKFIRRNYEVIKDIKRKFIR